MGITCDTQISHEAQSVLENRFGFGRNPVIPTLLLDLVESRRSIGTQSSLYSKVQYERSPYFLVHGQLTIVALEVYSPLYDSQAVAMNAIAGLTNYYQAYYPDYYQENQDKIYYVVAENFNTARNSPHLEVFRKKGIEVLLLSDEIDEWIETNDTEAPAGERPEPTRVDSGAPLTLDLGSGEVSWLA